MRGKLTMIAGWALMLATPLAAQAAPADLDSLFDAAGRSARELGEIGAGERREFTADGLASGVYVVRLVAGEDVRAMKIVIGR